MNRYWIAGVIMACASFAGAENGPAQMQPSAISFELPRLDGSSFVRLTDFPGRPMLLNFWGSECPPCVAEMPLLSSLARHHPEMQFLGIAVDQRSNAIRFLQSRPPGYLQLIVPQQAAVLLNRLGNKTGVLPFTVVLDAVHRVCVSHIGEVDAGWVSRAMDACGVRGAAVLPRVTG